MSLEIEKKYLIQENGISHAESSLDALFPKFGDLKDTVLREGTKIRQGYLPVEVGMEIANIIGVDLTFTPTEARLRNQGSEYFLTLKSTGGLSRDETPDAVVSKTVFDMYWPYAETRIEKVRLKKEYHGDTAEIDVYTDRDLIVAEVEVSSEEVAHRITPLGKDVTEDPNYKNKTLARTDFHRKFILTGGPRSGKSVTLDYIQRLQYPVVPESAREIIEEQLETGGNVVPWEKLLEFQLEVLHTSLQAEAKVGDWGTVFLDRGIPDAVAYCITNNVEPPFPLKDAIKSRDYKGVFVLDPLPYKADDVRKETAGEAAELHRNLIRVYTELGFKPIEVPVNLELSLEESVRERAHFVVGKSHILS